MKIITKKKVDEILKRITANEIIGIEYIKDIEAHTKFSENNADIAFEIGGIKGMTKIQNTLKRRYQNEQSIEKILERLKDAGGCDADCEYDKGWDSAIYEAISIVHEVAKEYNNGWIPCSERLPRDYEEVLADVRGIGFDSLKDAEMVGYFKEKGKWFYSHGMQYLVDGGKTRVIAWQPLPEPFKER